MGNELDEIRMRLGVWCSTQEDEIVEELQAMGQNIKDFPFKAIDNMAYCNDDKNIAIWNNKISSLEESLSEFERHKRHLLRLAFAINQYAEATWDDGNYSQTIYHLDEAVFTLNLAYKLRDDQASFDQAKSEWGRHAAEELHKRTTYILRAKVVAHWREHIYPGHPKLSNEKAAEWLKDTFPELSARKLAEYVSKAKADLKKLPPASKA